MGEVDAAREFFRRELGDNWEEALLAASAVARKHEPIPEVVDAQLRAVDLVSEKRRSWEQRTRDRVAKAWQVLWLHDALP